MKKIIVFMLTIALALCAAGLVACTPFDAEVTVSQVGTEQVVRVQWESETRVDKIAVTVEHDGKTVSRAAYEGKAIAGNSVEVDAMYGNLTVKVDLFTDDGSCHRENTVVLTAPEYNFAPLSGTMPVLLFTLSVDEITANGSIPTFVWLARAGAWDWDNLPDGVYPMPNASYEEYTQHDNYAAMVEKTVAYIKELAEANPESKFNLYLNDFNAYLYPQMILAQGVENYSLKLLSDGTASYQDFNKTFNVEDPSAVYAAMKEKLGAFVEEVTGNASYPDGEFSIDTGELRSYCYLLAREYENVEWWLTRLNGTLASTDSFLAEAKTYLTEKNIGKLLNALTDEGKETLKSLYHFGDEMFGDAQEKKIMVFLGTHLTSQANFAEYARFTMQYYGDEFVYYYKGHPATPTDLYPEKKAEFESLGIVDLDSSIAAELILFFYPDLYLCGYPSSTYLSVTNEEKACGLFGVTKENASQYEYFEMMDFYLAPIQAHGERFDSIPKTEEHDYFVAEFADERIALYDATANEIKYYEPKDGGFVECAPAADENEEA